MAPLVAGAVPWGDDELLAAAAGEDMAPPGEDEDAGYFLDELRLPGLVGGFDAEAELVACVLCATDPAERPAMLAAAAASDFGNPRLATLWHRMTVEVARGGDVDPVPLAISLCESGEYYRVGGAQVIAWLVQQLGSDAAWSFHARRVRAGAVRRELARIHAGGLGQVVARMAEVRKLCAELVDLGEPDPLDEGGDA